MSGEDDGMIVGVAGRTRGRCRTSTRWWTGRWRTRRCSRPGPSGWTGTSTPGGPRSSSWACRPTMACKSITHSLTHQLSISTTSTNLFIANGGLRSPFPCDFSSLGCWRRQSRIPFQNKQASRAGLIPFYCSRLLYWQLFISERIHLGQWFPGEGIDHSHG